MNSPFFRPVSVLRTAIEDVGGCAILLGRCLQSLARGKAELRATVYQIEMLGLRSLAIAGVTAVFTGMVMSLQFAFSLSRFGAKEYVGRVVALSIVRELGPVLTALMVGGRIGAGMAAEIGSMAVTEQVDAIRALGADPIRKLVVPRVVATMIALPLLTAIADAVGFLGGMFVSNVEFDIAPRFFLRTALESVNMKDFGAGIGKSPFFGLIIALVGCYHGLGTTGGTEGVGRSTTRTVVVTSIMILVSDFLLTKLFMAL